jgi:hypothetical protein
MGAAASSHEIESDWDPNNWTFVMAASIYLLRTLPTGCFKESKYAYAQGVHWTKKRLNSWGRRPMPISKESEVIDMSRCTSDIVFIPFTVFSDETVEILLARGGAKSDFYGLHANLIAIDIVNGTCDVFDPFGMMHSRSVAYQYARELVNDEKSLLLPARAKPRPYIVDYGSQCPLSGPQLLIESSEGSPEGICALWTRFVVYWRLKYPHLKVPEFPSRSRYLENHRAPEYREVNTFLREAREFHNAVMRVYNEIASKSRLQILAIYDGLVESRFEEKKKTTQRRTSKRKKTRIVYTSPAKDRSKRRRRQRRSSRARFI